MHLAERLLATFGSIVSLQQAPAEDLMSIHGIGPAKAASLQAAFEVGRRYVTSELPDRQNVVTPAEAATLFLPEMQLAEEECFKVALLDTRNKLMGMDTVFLNEVPEKRDLVKQVFQTAIKENAAAVILAHNHQKEASPEPSDEDIVITRELVQAGKLLDVPVLDHLVTHGQQYVSLRERQLGFDL